MTSSKNPYTKKYVDHYLQLSILEHLAKSEVPVRFTDLKEPGLENSLFMYHMNKLIKRGVVEKRDDQGFGLTYKGAHWVNMAGIDGLEPELLPRPLVQFVIRNNTKIFLSCRNGQLGEFLNKYLLPGGLHKYGISADAAAVQILANLFPGVQLTPNFLSVAEMITVKDGTISHVISHIFTVDMLQQIIPAHDELFDHSWVELSDITSDNLEFQKEYLLNQLSEKIRSSTMRSRELFMID